MQMSLEPWSRRLNAATQVLNVVGGICLIAIVAVVMAGVVMRYLFNMPLLGVNEIVQLTAVALVMAALPGCTFTEGHVAVDVFEKALGKWGRFLGDIASRLISGFVLALLCRRAFLKALDAAEWGDATNMLKMPIWPFYAILSVGAGLCVLVFAFQLIAIVLRGAE